MCGLFSRFRRPAPAPLGGVEHHEYRGSKFSTEPVHACLLCGSPRVGFTSHGFSDPNHPLMAWGQIGGFPPEASREACVAAMHHRIDEVLSTRSH